MAPTSNAATALSSWAVTNTTAGGCGKLASTAASSRPDRPGMLMSRKIASTWRSDSSRSAALASETPYTLAMLLWALSR